MLRPTRKNLRPEERRNQLLDCAQQLFALKGFEATTINDVMLAAGVSKGGFYHHFDSKEALLEALATRMAQDALSDIAPILEEAGLDPFARLERVLRQLRMRKTEINPDLSKAFEAVFDANNIVLFDRVRRAIAQQVAPVLVGLVEEGVADGVFNVPDPESCVEIILHVNTATYDMIASVLKQRDTGQRGDALERLYRMMRMQGIAVDRLLGLPDGSITWIEPGTLEKIFRL